MVSGPARLFGACVAFGASQALPVTHAKNSPGQLKAQSRGDKGRVASPTGPPGNPLGKRLSALGPSDGHPKPKGPRRLAWGALKRDREIEVPGHPLALASVPVQVKLKANWHGTIIFVRQA